MGQDHLKGISAVSAVWGQHRYGFMDAILEGHVTLLYEQPGRRSMTGKRPAGQPPRPERNSLIFSVQLLTASGFLPLRAWVWIHTCRTQGSNREFQKVPLFFGKNSNKNAKVAPIQFKNIYVFFKYFFLDFFFSFLISWSFTRTLKWVASCRCVTRDNFKIIVITWEKSNHPKTGMQQCHHIRRPGEATSQRRGLTVSPDVASDDFGIGHVSVTDAGEKRLQGENHAHLEEQRCAHGDGKSLLRFTTAGVCRDEVTLQKKSTVPTLSSKCFGDSRRAHCPVLRPCSSPGGKPPQSGGGVWYSSAHGQTGALQAPGFLSPRFKSILPRHRKISGIPNFLSWRFYSARQSLPGGGARPRRGVSLRM